MSTSDIGTTLAIATGLPATFTEAGYEAMSWVVVGGLQTAGQLGGDDATITVSDLGTGRARTLKGETTGGVVPFSTREIPGDAGQVAIAAAGLSRAEFSFRIGEPLTVERYISGPVMNYKRNEFSVTSYAGHTFACSDNYGVTSGT